MTARIGTPKTGGRVKGSLDKNARTLVTAEMAADLLVVYKKLGGVKWLLKFAQDNPKDFLQQGLSRLFPAPQKDDPDIQVNNQFNVGNMSDVEVAQRVAFALNKGLYAEEAAPIATVSRPVAEPMTPQEACDWKNPTPARDGWQPEPVEDPDRQRWASELALTPEGRADAALIRETRDCSLVNYHGSAAEQGGPARPERTAQTKSSAGELARRLSRRGRDLL